MFLNRQKFSLYKGIFFLSLFVFTSEIYPQLSVPGLPESLTVKTKKAYTIPAKQLIDIDTAQLLDADRKENIKNRYGIVQEFDADIKKAGVKTEIKEKGYIWQYKINALNAFSLGIFFKKYNLPEGARLFVYNESGTNIIGAFTNQNNKPEKQLALADFKGKNAIIEYFEPYNPSFNGELVIGAVSQAYKNIESVSQDRIGINCPEGDDWQDIKHSVCKITFVEGLYSYYCTGSLLNNVNEDATPYFLTANHCLSTNPVAGSLVAYFNYENSLCYNFDANSSQTLSGAVVRSTNSYSDFTLLELNETPPASYDAFYAGWNAGSSIATNTVTIHHPDGSPKCISVDNDAPVSYNDVIEWDDNSQSSANSHWEVKFNAGTTEGGSSGGPLLDQNKRIIGQLHGGDDYSSFYGKFSVSWNRSNLSSSNLKNWLNPDNTGSTILEGRYFKKKPKCDFNAKYTTVCTNTPVNFYDNSIYDPTQWNWIIEPANFEFVTPSTGNSRNPQIMFNEEGLYTVSLIVSNNYGTDTLIKSDYIYATNRIDVELLPVDPDSCLCSWEFNQFPVKINGAKTYTFTLEPADKISYRKSNDTLYLSLKNDYYLFGNFSARIKTKGTFGTCEDSDSLEYYIIIPQNDQIKNSIGLQPGYNGPYSNQCATVESKEPKPPLSDCYSNESWCPPFSSVLGSLKNTLWFTFTGPSSENITIETQNADTRITVYKAGLYTDILSGNEENYTIIGANDDRATDDLTSKLVNIPVEKYVKYWLQVDGSKNDTGTFSINLLGSSLEIYPNPNSGEFLLTISTMQEGDVDLKIYSYSGVLAYEKLYNVTNIANRFYLDLSDLPGGLYLVRASAPGENIITKMLLLKN